MNKFHISVLVIQAFFQNSNLVILRTCCDFQSTYLNGKCTQNNDSTKELQELHKPFPPTLTMGLRLNSSQGFQFQLRQKAEDFTCAEAAVKVYLDKLSGTGTIATHKLFPDGYLQIQSVILPPTAFCINSFSAEKDYVEVFACHQTCAHRSPCLPKCCPWGKVSRWLHPNLCYKLTQDRVSNLVPKERSRKTFIPFYHQNLNCTRQGRMVSTASANIFNSHQLNELLQSLTPGEYCFDDVITSHDMKFNWSHLQAVFYCGSQWPVDEFGLSTVEKTVYGSCFIISSMFLMATIVIYCIKLQRPNSSVHTWIELLYMISLMMLGIFFALHVYLPATQEEYCSLYHFIVVFGYTVFGVSLFSWASLLCFDLFIAFWKLLPLGSEMDRKDIRRLLWYCIIGFCFPFLVASTTFIYSYVYWKDAGFCIPLQLTAIRFIQGILLLLNTFFFICTFYLIVKHRRHAKFATERSHKQLNQLVSCFTKLFIISGITYGGVILGYMVGAERNKSWYMMVFRIFINLRGVTVFFIYAWNPQMKKLLRNRFQERILCGCIWCKDDHTIRNDRMISLRSTFGKTES